MKLSIWKYFSNILLTNFKIQAVWQLALKKPCFVLLAFYFCLIFQYQINATNIEDVPKFSFRGVMLDSSRHFLSMKVLIDQLDLMEMNKVPFIYYASACIVQNLISLPNFSQKLIFFRQNKRISFSTLHFDKIFIL